MSGGHVARINTDRREMDTAFLEIRQLFLESPQLGLTERSPMSAVKNQDRAIRREKIS